MLEECGVPYEYKPMNLRAKEQLSAAFMEISPNCRIPAIIDHEPIGKGAPLELFESGAILHYLGKKFGRLFGSNPRAECEVLQWLMWQVGGLGPMLGQNGHFLFYAKEEVPYARRRYDEEARRLYGVLDRQLAKTGDFIAGDYSIADIACFPWVMTHKAQNITLDTYRHVRRWFETLRARDAVQRGLAVGRA